MARFTLELGGKNPMIVLDDVNVEKAIQGALAGAFLNQGQVCAAVSRLYVPSGRLDEMLDGMSAAMRAMSLGPGMNADADVNPLVSSRHRGTVAQRVQAIRDEGGELVLGGALPDLPGYYFEPTLLLASPEKHAAITREEVFGPVLTVVPFDDVEQAIALANDSLYGLAASLWTENLSDVMHYVPRIQAGTVWVNAHLPLDPSLPFGGMKQSGTGREFGYHAVESFTEIKSVCIAY
jgi:phenylacetaldehyde dehydrogenase